MNWFISLFTEQSVPQAAIMYALVIALGIALGKIKLFGISFGITWVLFIGLLFSYFGISINKEIEHFIKEFGLVIFVYAIGLQVGPGFFSSLKKTALGNNALAATVVLTGVLITIIFFYTSGIHIATLSGVMSGAVTNTPGLAAAQAAVKDLHIQGADNGIITLAYAVAYPFAVVGIILSLVILRKVLRIDVEKEKELHRKLNFIQSNRPISIHLKLENRQLIGQPLRSIFKLLNEPVIISRMMHKGEIITPTPDIVLADGDIMLFVAPKKLMENVKLLVGSEAAINLKNEPGSNLISKFIVVTRKEITHKRLGNILELQNENLTISRIKRAGIEMVAHGNIFLQLGDTMTVVGTEESVNQFTSVVGNSLKRLESPDLGPIFIGIVLGIILGSIPFHIPSMPVAVKIGMAGGPLIVALFLSRFGNFLYLNNYTTNSANLMIRELGIALFLASVGLSSGQNLSAAFADGSGYRWILMGITITMVPLLIVGVLAKKFFKKTYFEISGLLAGACTDPPALAFALKVAGNDIPSATYATVYPLTMILRILAAQLLILFFA
ncbi:MAG: putative transporter [Chitinophagaceae bacterium]|nr:putative transporter [Chitinophagaceae bacterium]